MITSDDIFECEHCGATTGGFDLETGEHEDCPVLLRQALTAAQEEAQRTRDELESLQEYRAELAKNYAQAMVDNVGLEAQNAKLRVSLRNMINAYDACKCGCDPDNMWEAARAALEAKC